MIVPSQGFLFRLDNDTVITVKSLYPVAQLMRHRMQDDRAAGTQVEFWNILTDLA